MELVSCGHKTFIVGGKGTIGVHQIEINFCKNSIKGRGWRLIEAKLYRSTVCLSNPNGIFNKTHFQAKTNNRNAAAMKSIFLSFQFFFWAKNKFRKILRKICKNGYYLPESPPNVETHYALPTESRHEAKEQKKRWKEMVAGLKWPLDCFERTKPLPAS